MEVIILGSGTGTPTLKRNAAGLLIKIDNKNLLFDTGPGTVRRLLEIGLTYHDIDYIFYTHFHTDHTLDLAVILFAAKYILSLRSKELTIVAHRDFREFYDNFLNLYGQVIRPEAYQVKFREIGEDVFKLGSSIIKAMPMQHTPESLGYRVEANGRTVVYSGDTDVCENIVKLGEQADVLILDCSFPDEMKVKGHLTPQEAGTVARECNCRRLVLSHLYPVCKDEQIIKQARKTFKGEIVVAHDLMSLRV